MPTLNANLSMLFTEVDFLDRFNAAAKNSFTGVEYLFPYDFAASDIKQRLDDHQLTQVLFNLPAGNWAEGDRGIASHPDRVNEFREGVHQAIEYAQQLGCHQCNVLAGKLPRNVSLEKAREQFIENLQYAVPLLAEAGISTLIEAINTRDIPGFVLSSSQQAVSVMEAVQSEHLYFQYDVYHMQIMEGDLAHAIKSLLPKIKHIQIADTPGRHEPGTGEINYPFLFKYLEEIGYTGWVGCEYIPQGDTESGLGWIKDCGLTL